MSFLRRYFGYVRPHLLALVGSFLAGLVFVAFSGVAYWLAADFIQALFRGGMTVPPLPEGPVGPGSVAQVLKHYSAQLVQAGSPLETLRRAIGLTVIAFLIKNLALYAQVVLAAHIQQAVARTMRDQLYDRLLAQDLAFFHRRKSGDLVAAGINDINVLNSGLAESFAKLLRDPLTALLFLLLLLSISWKMTLAAAIIAPLAGAITGFAGNSLKRKSKRTQTKVGAVSAALNEILYGMRIVQAYGGEKLERRRFQQATETHFREALRRERLRRLIQPIEELSGVLVIAAILMVAGGQVLSGNWLGPDDFVRFLLLLFGLLAPIVSLADVVAKLKVSEGAAERVFELLDSRHEIDSAANPTPVSGFHEQLRLEDVSLEYGGERTAALRSVHAALEPGERVLLVGRSGSGKSSLLNLLPRFYDPTGGRITLDGVDLRELELDSLRGLFGIVTQQITLFHDSVRNNIAYGLEVSDEEVERAARAAAAHDFIEELPEGYETDLGDVGGRLSGGQRQRISIARAIVRDPAILLLDEPTSSLDADVADELEQTLEEIGRGRTVLMATHRLASIREQDRVLLFDQGRLVADGIHRDLMASRPDYRELIQKQTVQE